MRTVLFSSVGAAAMLLAASAVNAADSVPVVAKTDAASAMGLTANGRKAGGVMGMPGVGVPGMNVPGMHVPGVGMPKPGGMMHGGGPRPGRPPMMGGMRPGGQHAGFTPRPGYHGIPQNDIYRRPQRGFILPRYWVQPSFTLSNFGSYGLRAPSNGYYWSRYYDDAVLTDQRGYVQDYRSGIDWNSGYNNGPDRTNDYREPEYGPAMRPDANAYNWNDEVAFAAPDGSSYSYDGEWSGDYVDPQGRVFEGEWSGKVTRHNGSPRAASAMPASRVGAPYAGPPERDAVQGYAGPPERDYTQGYAGPPERAYAGNGYAVPRGYEGYERCLKSNGVTGAAIGGILGGVAGNRIAGRGDRLGGTLLGAGLGGLAGLAVEKALDKCKRYQPRYEDAARRPAYPQQGYYPPQQQGWQGGYYYYPQSPSVTVTVVPGATHTTTTVTEEVYYENVKTYPRKKAVRKWKPRPKPRCVCN